jgi:His Kinase A (phospho-acceptor) domain
MHRLLRTLSHEIRNPLHGILGNSQALLELLREVEQQAAETVKCVTAVTAAMTAAATAAAATDSTADIACMLVSDSPTVVYSTDAPLLSCSTVDTNSSSSSSSSGATAGSNGTGELTAAAGGANSSSNGGNSISSSSGSSSSRRSLDRHMLRMRCSKSAPALRPRPPYTDLKHSSSFNGTSSSGSSSRRRSESHLSEALTCSAKMAEAQCLVAEIHECALHQVSDPPCT